MKTKITLAAIMAFGILTAGCSRDDDARSGGEDDSGSGTITVAIKSENPSTTRAIGNPTQVQENTVKSFMVYVFHYGSGAIEKSEIFTGVLSGEITGLSTASTKRVVVLVNPPAEVPVNSYTQLTELLFGLPTQVPGDFSTKGLLMSGEYPGEVTLSATETKRIEVPVTRNTAKVRLESLTVSPDEYASLKNFTLLGVSIQKARSEAFALTGLAPDGAFQYVGGLKGKISQTGPQVAFLYEKFALPPGYVSGTALKPEIYFYVFPNDNQHKSATSLVLHGQYKDAKGKEITMYYPFVINDKVGTGNSTTDGKFIERNKIYTLHVTLEEFDLGANDPDAVNEEAKLKVDVKVTDWEGDLIQHVEW